MKKIAVAVHIHQHGSDGYVFAYDGNRIPNDEQVAAALKLDYEPGADNLEIAHLAGTPNFPVGVGIDPEKLPFVAG